VNPCVRISSTACVPARYQRRSGKTAVGFPSPPAVTVPATAGSCRPHLRRRRSVPGTGALARTMRRLPMELVAPARPASRSSFMIRVRVAALGAPSTTPTTRLPPRTAETATLNPEAQGGIRMCGAPRCASVSGARHLDTFTCLSMWAAPEHFMLPHRTSCSPGSDHGRRRSVRTYRRLKPGCHDPARSRLPHPSRGRRCCPRPPAVKEPLQTRGGL
jgi:hypothetical protein